MRLVTWNCRVGGFRYKAKHIAAFRPDVLTVQEVEPLDNVLLFSGDDQPTCRDRIGDPAYPRRAIGTFSYTGVDLASADADVPRYGFRRYRAQRNGLHFQVVAVWTAATKFRNTSYMQAIEGVQEHAEWIAQGPLGLVSAYHEHFQEPFGAESRPTHYFKGNQGSPFHLDYCFVPKVWAGRIKIVTVGGYDEWHTVSDHVPLMVDLDL